MSGVTEFGLYVETDESKCEGMVPLRDLADDYYEFDEKNYCLVGRRHHRRYSIGDKVRIRVARANLERRMLDFALVTPEGKDDIPSGQEAAAKRAKANKSDKEPRRSRGRRSRR